MNELLSTRAWFSNAEPDLITDGWVVTDEHQIDVLAHNAIVASNRRKVKILSATEHRRRQDRALKKMRAALETRGLTPIERKKIVKQAAREM